MASTVEDGIEQIEVASNEGPRPLVINAAFALHHVRTDGLVSRQAVIDRLSELRPAAFVLAEPHASHATEDLEHRVMSAWVHYGRVFAALEGLGLADEELDAVVRFFSAEVRDVVGNDETTRQERHEPISVWSQRLRCAGLELDPTPPRTLVDPTGSLLHPLDGALAMGPTVHEPVVGLFRARTCG